MEVFLLLKNYTQPSSVLAKDSKDNDVATAAGAASTAGQKYYITGVDASYTTASTSGLLQLKDGTTVIFERYIHGAGSIPFDSPIVGTANTAFSAVLAASGTGGVLGKVNLRGFLF